MCCGLLPADGRPLPIDLPAVKASVRERLAAIYPKEAGDFTQALMELGATVCGPNRKPECGSCPCRKICLGYQHGTAETLPVKSPSGSGGKDRTVFILQNATGNMLWKSARAKGLLAGAVAVSQWPDIWIQLRRRWPRWSGWGFVHGKFCGRFRESTFFHHIQWNMKGIYLEVAEASGGFSWFTAEQIDAQAALPTAFRLFLGGGREMFDFFTFIPRVSFDGRHRPRLGAGGAGRRVEGNLLHRPSGL